MDHNSQAAEVYDFVHPGHKLNKSWPVLDLVTMGVASSFGAELADKLQIALKGDAVSTHRGKYSECVNAIGKTAIVHEISLSPLPGVAWFCLDISVISAVVESYFGGQGRVIPIEEARPLSNTEMRVTQHIISCLLVGLKKGWSMLLNINPALVRPIDVGRLANSAREPIMIVSELMLSVEETQLPCSMIYPFEMLEPMSEQLLHEVMSNPTRDDEFSMAMQRELMNCELNVRGVMSETQITLGKLLELKPGDFIPLRDVENVSFKTDSMPLFDAQVGVSNGRVSASLSRWHLPVAS